jgi:lycopene cyclase domain-containing protein
MPGLYLVAIVFSLCGLAILDRKFNLTFFANARLATLTTAVAVVFFSIWDALGIANGIFFKGDNSLLIGVQLFHEYPIEEAFFLTLLAYCGQLTMAGWLRFSKQVDK